MEIYINKKIINKKYGLNKVFILYKVKVNKNKIRFCKKIKI